MDKLQHVIEKYGLALKENNKYELIDNYELSINTSRCVIGSDYIAEIALYCGEEMINDLIFDKNRYSTGLIKSSRHFEHILLYEILAYIRKQQNHE